MDQKERDAQRALGNMDTYQVTVSLPIKMTVKLTQNVEAVNEDDAIEKVKILHDIIPDRDLLRKAIEAATKYFYADGERKFDPDKEREYSVQSNHSRQDAKDACDSGSSC